MTAVAERIIQVAVSRLEEITTGNGYPFTASVQRGTRATTESPGDHTIYVSVDSITPNPNLDYPGDPPVQGWEMLLRCACVVSPLEASTDAADAIRMQAWTAMSQAITAGTAWYRFAEVAGDPPVTTNLATNTRLESPDLARNAEQGAVGATLIARIMFRVSEGDPEAVRP